MFVAVIIVCITFFIYYIWTYLSNISINKQISNYKIIISDLEHDISNLRVDLQIIKEPLKQEISRLQNNVNQLLVDNHRLLEMNVSREKIMIDELCKRYSNDQPPVSDEELTDEELINGDSIEDDVEYNIPDDTYDHSDIIYCIGNGNVKAKGVMTNLNEIVVLAGSRAAKTGSKRIPRHIKKLREELKRSEVMVLETNNGYYCFSQDYTFSAPSTASAVILGKNSNGWYDWTNFEGETLDALYRSKQIIRLE